MCGVFILIIIGVGMSKTISISNTIKMIANRKKRIENGVRAEWFGSKPHSNGDSFSRSFCERVDRIYSSINNNSGIIIDNMSNINNIYIYSHLLISYD